MKTSVIGSPVLLGSSEEVNLAPRFLTRLSGGNDWAKNNYDSTGRRIKEANGPILN